MRTLKRIAVGGLQILGALSFCGIALYLAQTGVDVNWIVIGVVTVLLFGFVCYRTKDYWSNPRYWATFGGAFVLHVVAVVLVQRNYPMIPGVYYCAFGTLEGAVLSVLLVLLFNQ